ncbi:MAG: hypothetical protein ACK5L5_01535 [Bacteroidales bacterium]
MKRVRLIFVSLMTVSIIAYLHFIKDDVLERKRMSQYLFSNKSFEANQKCHKDLIGLTFDGSTYDFYSYEIENDIKVDLTGNYPKFDSIFDFESLLNIHMTHWTETPIKPTESNYYFNIAFSGNLSKSDCSDEFQKQNFLKTKGNFYSFFSAYPIGTYLFVHVPNKRVLYVISKKG